MSDERHELEGVKRRESRSGFPWIRAAFFVLVCFLVYLPFSPIPGKVKRGLKEIFGESGGDRTVEAGDDVPPDPASRAQPDSGPLTDGEGTQPPGPEHYDPDPPFPTGVLYPRDGTDVRKLSRGIPLSVTLDTEDGGLASAERGDKESYVAEYKVQVRVPRPAKTLPELSRTNSELGKLLPGLEGLLANGQVSPWYSKLYANKLARVKSNVAKLDDIVTKHNFYDCETMLNLRSKETNRRVFLIQSEMDVVSDGSDGDRMPEMPDEIVNSTNYQPTTSFAWKKTGTTPNPMIAGWEQRIRNADKELAESGTSAARKKWLRDRKDYLQRGIADMKRRSFLVAEHDPFIVIPKHMVLDREDPYCPNVGDFAVVVHGKKIYPAIVGDAGPTYKVGEASLRMARQIDPNSTPYRRPVSDLVVTYIVFPRSGDKTAQAPDYERWKTRCAELLGEIGGLGDGVELHSWPDTFPKKEESGEANAATEE